MCGTNYGIVMAFLFVLHALCTYTSWRLEELEKKKFKEIREHNHLLDWAGGGYRS